MNSLPIFSQASLEKIRLLLAGAKGLLLLSLLGLICGILAGGIIILFRLLIETSQISFLPDSNPENYEALQWQTRLLLTTGGGLVLGLLFYFISRQPMRVGVLHTLERLNYHEGHLPLKNAVMQFVGGAISIISGHSVGREGPSVHLGAASASLLGQKLRLPNNSIRTLVACGSAAAIAASFNTPLAGVIFAMEVIMMEYTITGFTPVILAAVSATTISRITFDAHPAFNVPALELYSFWELPFIVLMGITIGAVAAAFINSLKWITRQGQKVPVWLRMTLAGMAVGVCALLAPEVMGIGYDTVDAAFLGEIGITTLLLIFIFKWLATVISIGMGLPAGLIGPTLFIGAMAGSLSGACLGLLPIELSHPGLYAMLGMGAMMGATLQAPLAALLALLELTGNQNIIFPGMLAIVSASLASKEIFGASSVYLSLMKESGLDYRNDPVAQSLRRLAVASVMNREFAIVQTEISRNQAENILAKTPHWLVISREESNLLMPAADLARHLEENQDEQIQVMEIPSKRKQLAAVIQQSTLQQALKILDESEAEALYVIRPLGTSADHIFGIVTRQDIEEAYRHRSVYN